MDNYIKNYDTYQATIVYQHERHDGGVGDYMRFFMNALYLSMQFGYRMTCMKNENGIQKYIRMKYPQMYITKEEIGDTWSYGLNNIERLYEIKSVSQLTPTHHIIGPGFFYNPNIHYPITQPYRDVFFFSDDVIQNSAVLLPDVVQPYISIHLRLGDRYLETDQEYVVSKLDSRSYNEQRLFECIEEHADQTILFFCDNHSYKQKIKEKYSHVIITTCPIGHTSLSNTTPTQILDGITELYIMTNSTKIYSASWSGFSHVAAKYHNIPLIKLY
jgi:hypothetical protein